MKLELEASTKILAATIVGQALTIALYPVISRLYTPSAIGAYTAFMTVSAFMVPLATGCYDQAVIQTHSAYERENLLRLVRKRVEVFLLTAGALGFLLSILPLMADYRDYLKMAMLACLLAAFNAVFNTLSEMLVRIGGFNQLAVAKVISGGGSPSVRSVLGLFGSSGGVMIAGELIARGAVAVWSLRTLMQLDGISRGLDQRPSFQQTSVSPEYSRFPRIVLPEQLLNIAAGGIHAVIIPLFFGMQELGYVALAASMLTFPVTIITASIKDVFRSFGAVDFRERGTCRPLFLRFFLLSGAIGVIIFLPLYFYADIFIVFVFGDQWAQSVDYTRILIPMFFANFVAMNFAGVMIFTDRLREALFWQSASLLATLTALLVGAVVFKSVVWTLILVSAVRTASYVSYAGLAFYFSKSQGSLGH